LRASVAIWEFNSDMEYMELVYLVFNICEEGLYDMAAWLGISYEELNILLFLILHPLYSIVLTLICLSEYLQGKSSTSYPLQAGEDNQGHVV